MTVGQKLRSERPKGWRHQGSMQCRLRGVRCDAGRAGEAEASLLLAVIPVTIQRLRQEAYHPEASAASPYYTLLLHILYL